MRERGVWFIVAAEVLAGVSLLVGMGGDIFGGIGDVFCALLSGSVVGVVFQQAPGAVELLGNHYTHQWMGQGEWRQ